MAHGKSDDEIIRTTRNTARFFTETRQISWVLLLGTVIWGIFGYFRMPQRKDPDIPPRQALAICAWPGAQAENRGDARRLGLGPKAVDASVRRHRRRRPAGGNGGQGGDIFPSSYRQTWTVSSRLGRRGRE